ncbi:hypothetical protein HDZ31DRAFT_31839 [Schizophyllum fasciatum]
MSSRRPSAERILRHLRERYIPGADRGDWVCQGDFLDQLLALETYLKDNRAHIVVSGSQLYSLADFLARHLLRVLIDSRRFDPYDVLSQRNFNISADRNTLTICRTICQRPRGSEHGELASVTRTGCEIMLDILVRLDQADLFLSAASNVPQAAPVFNFLVPWLKRTPDFAAASVVRYASLSSSPAVLIALIAAIADSARRDAVDATLAQAVAQYVAQCGEPPRRAVWLDFLRRLGRREAKAGVYNCTLVLNWMDLHREFAHCAHLRALRKGLIDTAARIVVEHRLSITEISCHRDIVARAATLSFRHA